MARPQKLSEEEIQVRLSRLEGWSVEEGMLRKKFRFKRFMDGIQFVNQVARIAEEMDHHPDIYIRFGLVTISLMTHSARGITELDFQQAERLDGLVWVRVVRSVNVGTAVERTYEGRTVTTSFFKRPVAGAVRLTRLGLEGDEQVDRVHHGGPDKAVLIYPYAHYAYWERWLGRDPGPAALGENLTVEGLTEETVCIGDRYRIGEAVVEVSQPRIPCFKINLRHGAPEMRREVERTGYTGFYVRVLEEGRVAAGDEVVLLHRPDGAPTVAQVSRRWQERA